MSVRKLSLGLMACALLAMTAVSSQARPQPSFGSLDERDIKVRFQVLPGSGSKDVVLILPKEVNFPGDHKFSLTKGVNGAFEDSEPGRPTVSLLFKSPTLAALSVRGTGKTETGVWITDNEYVLIKP